MLVDAGCPPPFAVSQEAHAGCLSFELSARQQRIVVNCGLPTINRETWRQVARATAAHSAVVLNDTSSCRFLETGTFKRLIGTPIVSGPSNVPVAREKTSNAIVVRASHDGYADRFNLVHQRALMLATDAYRLDGEDLFVPAGNSSKRTEANDEFAIRFHLHPSVKANRLSDGKGVMLMLPNKDVWTFDAYENQVEIEESVYLSGNDGPRRTMQIVIHGHARQMDRVHWTFSHVSPSAAGARRERGDEPELPLS